MSLAEIRDNARLAVERDPVRMRLESTSYHASLVLLRAIRLAPTLEVCEAILRGERVPKSQMDQNWLRTYAFR